MKNLKRRWWPAAVLAAGISACTPAPPYVPPVTLYFQLPDKAKEERLALAAVYYTRDQGQLKLNVMKGVTSYVSGTEASVSIYPDQLAELVKGGCLPYRSDVPRTEEYRAPATATSCEISFLVYDASQGMQLPTTSNLRYLTHDTYAYASEDFSYRSRASAEVGSGSDRRTLVAEETGKRRKGWSLVRHLVINPAGTPDRFLVTRDSVPDSFLDQRTPLRMHEPSDPLTSMSLNAQGGPQ